MRLNSLKPARGAKHPRKRVGRGIGSGQGKTAGLGHKGQKARSGGYHKVGFEGGQMPLQRRLPKRGFINSLADVTAEVNVGALEVFSAGAKVDEASLRSHGLVKGRCDRIKILGKGELTKAVTVTAHSFSKSAQEKIQKAGGKALLLETVTAPASAR